jgi:hypothetical protein
MLRVMATCTLCRGRGYLTSLDCVGRDDACGAAAEERHPCACQPEDSALLVRRVVGQSSPLVVRSTTRPHRPFGFADR